MNDNALAASNGTAVVTDPNAEKLLELRAKRRAINAAREARDAERSAAELVAVEERGLAEDEAIAAAEVEHGAVGKKIFVVRTPAGIVIVKRPNHVLYRRYQDKGEATSLEFEKLVRPCLVYPSVEQFDRLLDDLPGILIDVANGVAYLAGSRAKEQLGK
jgi:hypothetical protein